MGAGWPGGHRVLMRLPLASRKANGVEGAGLLERHRVTRRKAGRRALTDRRASSDHSNIFENKSRIPPPLPIIAGGLTGRHSNAIGNSLGETTSDSSEFLVVCGRFCCRRIKRSGATKYAF